MFSRFMYYTGLVACIGMIGACFLPWVHFNSIGETFTGFNVSRFPGGNYYGKAGRVIVIFTALIFTLMLLPKLWAKRVNLFLAGLLLAYCLRTYTLFTSSLFVEEIQKKIGIYLMVICSILIMGACLFPANFKSAKANESPE